jgi:hypothetical protein
MAAFHGMLCGHQASLRGRGLVALGLLCLGILPPAIARGASKVAIAVLGDPAPGGGVFAGPGFTGWPAAGGIGWIAFRGEIIGGGTSEAIVVAHMASPVTRAQVASIGQAAPGGGSFRQFVGRPAVNANGDVAFVALLTRTATDDESDPSAPVPAGLFLYRGGELHAVARSGDLTAAGMLDLTGSIDAGAEPDEVPERTPALNDGGDVAFLSALRDNPHASGAIFLALRGEHPTPVLRLGDPFDGGTFTRLGPPALNNEGLIAFHGITSADDSANSDGFIDGVFATLAGSVWVLVRDGLAPMPLNVTLRKFEDPVALNDRGDATFVAGPLLSTSDDTVAADEDSPGVLVVASGVVTAIAYPGSRLGPDRVTGLRLGPAAGSLLAPPTITPEGRVAFFATLNGGSREAIAFWDGVTAQPLLYTGGTVPGATPAGGLYAGAQSAPVVDQVGGIAFLARIVGGGTSEAIIYQPPQGEGLPIVVGDAAPNAGFFAGHPFSDPLLNDDGDVVFRAYVARGPTSVGIFRSRDGELEALVRAGDPAPGPEGTRFLDLVGTPRLNQQGAVVFAAQISGGAVGIYAAEGGAVRPVVVAGDPAPGEIGDIFKALGVNPVINDQGAIAFRATALHRDTATNTRVSREGVFLADGFGIRPLASTGVPTPFGLPFFRLRDPAVTNNGSVVFRASLGSSQTVTTGLFLADASGATPLALEQDDLGGGVRIFRLSNDPTVPPAGDLAFLATRSREISPGVRRSLGPAILRQTAVGLDLIVAQGMPGPTGGTFRSFGVPTMNAGGHIAFRGSFLPLTGGTTGIFLDTETGVEPYLSLGEVTPAGGRFTAVNARSSLNAHDELAFGATVTSGAGRHGIFLASRTRLDVRPLEIRLRRGKRDRVRLGLRLRVGRRSNGLDPAREPIILSVSDGRGLLWSTTVAPGTLEAHGDRFVVARRRRKALSRRLTALHLVIGPGGHPRVTAMTSRLDLTQHGRRPLEPPFSVALQIGDDSGSRMLPCLPRPRGVRCNAR